MLGSAEELVPIAVCIMPDVKGQIAQPERMLVLANAHLGKPK